MPENDIFERGRKLPLMEEFYSLQGEGYHTGRASYFIRVGGCDIGCSWCDSKRSWDADRHPLVPADDIISRAAAYPSGIILVTGGEPTMYELGYLCDKAKEAGFKIFLETSGTYQLTGSWDWICLSPKKHNPPVEHYYTKANELKVIVSEPGDFPWAEEVSKKVNEGCHLFLQPEWSRKAVMTDEIIDYVRGHPQWRISMQAHKVWRIP